MSQSGSLVLHSKSAPPTSSAPSSASADSKHSMELPDDKVCVCVCVYGYWVRKRKKNGVVAGHLSIALCVMLR